MEVYHPRGDAWQKLLVTYYTGLHSQGKTVLLAPLPRLTSGESLLFFNLALTSPFFLTPSPPVHLEVHVCHLLQALKVKLCAYKPISISFEQHHSVGKANQLEQAPEYSSVQPTCTTPEATASAMVMNHKFRTQLIDPLKVIIYRYYC